jgi:hypothetical protein
MGRVVTVLLVIVGLAMTGGCFKRSTEADIVKDRGALDRLKKDTTGKDNGTPKGGKKKNPTIPD